MRDYFKCLAAYLTGWVIAQAIFNRVVRHMRETAWTAEKEDIADRAADYTVKRLALVGPEAERVFEARAQELGADVYGEIAVAMGDFGETGAPISVTPEMVCDAVKRAVAKR